jgi:heat shock protein HslJ
MDCNRLNAGWLAVLSTTKIAVGLLMTASVLLGVPAHAAEGFPFDRVLLLDVAPMRPLKRVPILTVQENGSATVELWCRTANARVQISGEAIKIEAAPLPEALPQYMSTGQCSDDRVQADNEMLEALTQVTEWRRRGDGVVLIGVTQMPFRASSH